MSTHKLTAVLAFCALALAHVAASSQPVETATAQAFAPAPASAPVDGKALAERFIRPTGNKGVVALVFDDNGNVIAVTREGRTVPTCQVCTPEMERRYGPRCAKARHVSDLKSMLDDKPASAALPPLVCDKLDNTTIEDVNPISAVKHTGSQCISFFFNANGQAQVYQYCW